MRSYVFCKLKICSTHFSHVSFHGHAFNRETYLASKQYFSGRSFSSKDIFPKDRVTNKTEIKDSDKKKSYMTERDTSWKKGGENVIRNWRDSSLPRPSSKSVFAAGTAKRTAETQRRKATLVFEMEQTQLDDTRKRKITEMDKLPERPLSISEWRELKESMGNSHLFENSMMGQMLKFEADLDIAKSLLTFVVTETGTLSYKLLLRYLTLCVKGGHDREVFDIYDIMQATFPSLDTGAFSLFIQSFSRTERWKEALDILQNLKRVSTPTSRNYGNIISAAAKHNDFTTAWGLYDELIEKGLNPFSTTWETLFNATQGAEKTDKGEKMIPQFEHEKRLLDLLHHMRDNQIYPHENLAEAIKTWFESLEDQKWEGRWTSISPKGTCRCCGSELEPIQLTADEYKQLKNQVMVNVIQGPDVFKKTNPEELDNFKQFVKRNPNFDVVVDGLNVANLLQCIGRSDTLLTVVSELTRQGLEVLVLGRKHMLSPSRHWNRRNMNLLQLKALCFFTENISEDDPFLLYAALHSGNHCRFVSQDLMRDHKACLPDGVTKRLFFKWQRGHQMVVDSIDTQRSEVRFQDIPCYDTIIQTSAGSWHIPYDDSLDRSTYEVPQKWLCLTNRR